MIRSALAGVLLAGLTAGAAHAEMLKFTAKLDTMQEVPPKTGPGTGTLDATLDTASKKLTYTLTFSGLSGPATSAHFHGPAGMGVVGSVEVPISGLTSPSHGSATLTKSQVADMKAGRVYVNIHTAANPGGEIRGQVMPAK